jgi:hypothetical protein
MTEERIKFLIEELKRLEIRQAVVIAELEATNERRTNGNTTTSNEASTTGLTIGDRVRITNQVKKPATWNNTVLWDKERERLATVTRVSAKQIHFVTDNGTNTWRAPNNLKKLS